MRWPKAVVFDLDGTLVDSAPDIARALADGFAPLGIGPFSLADVRTMIGGGAAVAIRRAAGMAGVSLSDTQESDVYERFMRTYAEASAAGKGLYPGAVEILAALQGQGVRLGLVTNKSERITHIALDALQIAHYFKAVVGARDDLPKKPDPAPLQLALGTLGSAPDEAVMIGDSAADIGAAKAAGCRSIAVSYGYSRVAPAELGADALIDSLSEVRAALARLGSG